MGKVYVGDIGTAIIIDCEESLVDVLSNPVINVKKPNGTTAQWTGAVYDTTKVKYSTIAGDLDVAGTYILQPYVAFATWSGKGVSVELQVYPAFG